ncbi:hypothetical protein HQ520_16175 [bacterium]|nr:hypothetical protein [bacterium]
MAVFNAPEGVLEDIREAAADVVVFDTWYDVFGFQGDVVLLGPGRFENLEEFHRFISSLSNGSVSCPLVVLNQVWGGSPPVWHDSAITVHAPEHALLRDLTVDDFRGWDWDDRSLSACPAIPPPPGNFRRLVGAGPPGILLLHIPLPNGRSAFLAQYALWNRLEIEPAAPVLLNRLLSVALGSSGTPLQGSVSLIGDPESPFVLRLQLALVGEEAKLSVLPGDREDLQLPVPPAAVLLDASGEGADHLYSRDPEFAEKTRRFAESGGVACLFAVEPDTRDLFDWALPDSVDLETSNDSSGELALTDEEALARTGADAWIRALAKSGEMYRFADENRGGPASVSDFFRLESVGRGKVCFFQFRPGSAPTEALRLIVNQTLTNLGVRIFPENGIMSSN